MGKKIQCIGRYVMNAETLGKGNFARVELATHGITGCKVAIKIIDTRKIKEDYTRNNLHREARILAQIRHPHIVRLYETLKATSLYCLALEYVAGGDLLTFIKSQKEARLQEPKARQLFRQLVSALHFLHERGVAHRDLKMENVLLDGKHMNLKVIDFGLSNTFSSTELMKTHCGSLEYAAPELIASGEKYGPEVDNWSLGIILYGMVIGKLPFSTHYTDQYRRQKLLIQIEKGLTEIHLKDMTLLGLSPDLSELLKKLIEPSVELRLPLLDCEIHPWVTCNNKLPFVPFHSLPRDKLTRAQVIEELAALLKTTKDQVDATVHESKCDDHSAMFNMMLDAKRVDLGLFDMDFTLKQEVNKEKHRRKHHHKTIRREEKIEQRAPIIVCPDVDAPSDHEADQKVPPSHNSTNFDLMALCSAPTWLGRDRRKSRKWKPLSRSQSQNPDAIKAEAEEAAIGGHEPQTLLCPTQASAHVSQLLRRNSSRRRSRKGSSIADIHSRSSSLRRSYRRRSGTPGSGPHSPHSPVIFNTPEIKIITPKQSPITAVKRPAHLQGLKDCYEIDNVDGITHKSTRGRHLSYSSGQQRQNKIGRKESDSIDCGFCVQSENSNPCSTIKINEPCNDGFENVGSRTSSFQEFRTSVLTNEEPEPTVESLIAAVDIRSIVRPKQIVLKSKVNDKIAHDNICNNSQESNVDPAASRHMSPSPEVIFESMQYSTFANLSNLSDDEKIKRRLGCEIQKTDSEKRVEIEKLDCLNAFPQPSAMIYNAAEILGATNWKHLDNEDVNIDKVALCNLANVNIYANDGEKDDLTDKDKQYRMVYQTKTYVADLYSNREKLSLANNNMMQDGIYNADNSDRIALQANFGRKCLYSDNLIKTKRISKNSSLHEAESVSAPILLSPQEQGSQGNISGEFLRETIANSVLSSRRTSTPSVYFVMPSTASREMFHTPIARMESFHSDDFDTYTSDIDAFGISPTSSSSSTSSSIPTPTVPCFQYKRYSRRKKHTLKKASKYFSSIVNDWKQRTSDETTSIVEQKNLRDDACLSDPSISSSSKCGNGGHVPVEEISSISNKATNLPMKSSKKYEINAAEISITRAGEDQGDGRSTKLVTQMNNGLKLIPENQVHENDSKMKNTAHNALLCQPSIVNETKKSGWRRGFVHLLKKKKPSYSSPSGNNNNEDSPSRNNSENNSLPPNTRNGHVCRPPSNVVPQNTLDLPATSIAIEWSAAKVVQNNVKECIESGTSDLYHSPHVISTSDSPIPSPTKPKMFDFTIVSSDAVKNKHCFLSWKACRQCTFSDNQSSSEDNSEPETNPRDSKLIRSSLDVASFNLTHVPPSTAFT